MEAVYYAARANLRRLMILHPNWTRGQLAQATAHVMRNEVVSSSRGRNLARTSLTSSGTRNGRKIAVFAYWIYRSSCILCTLLAERIPFFCHAHNYYGGIS